MKGNDAMLKNTLENWQETILSRKKPLSRWDKMDQVSGRVRKLRDRFTAVVPEISVQRALLITESYEETWGQSAVFKRAKALEKILAGMDIYIAPDEMIVGSLAEKPRSVPLFPEFDIEFITNELDTFALRIADRFLLSEKNKKILKKVLPKWQDNTIKDQAARILPPDSKEAMQDFIAILTAFRSGVGHMIVDYGYGVDNGLLHIIQYAENLKNEISVNDPESASKRDYYDAVVISCKAVIAFAQRFAELARKLAAGEKERSRKRELLKIAAVCEKVPAQPAGSFWEALQSFWFIHLALQLESNGHSVSPGRFDQYMYKYYKEDAERDERLKDLGEELLHCLWIKLSEVNKVRDRASSVAFGGYPMFQHLTVGGQNASGKSAVNELSHICLEATAKVGLTQPSLSIRWFFGCPDDFLTHAVETASYGTGMPAFFNDEVLIPNMLQQGYNLEESREYGIVGCTESTGAGISEPWLTGGFSNIVKVLERTIFNGYDPVNKIQRKFKTGAPESFKTFEAFRQAYFEQLSYYLKQQVILDNILDKLHGSLVPTPFESAVTRYCLERGKTSLEGGASHNSTTFEAVGIANVADSLATIKKLIYEEKTLTWKELKEALLSNYEGHEELRLMIKNQVPKYGTDNDYVDSLGEEVLDHLYRELKAYKNPRGGDYYIALYTIACNVLLSDKVGATPDGRKMGMVLADGGVSCSQGSDKEGPTALLKSVSKLDPYKALGSTLLNVKFHPNIFKESANYCKIADLVKTYFMMKGQHVQFNVIDVETLRDAQKNPEKYPCLVVRVSGFSVLFTTIDPKCQEDIIMRTEHNSH